jgi:uncharacterized OB-fold protein
VAQVPIRPGLFTASDDPRGPRLLAGHCGACGRYHFPRADICPHCGAEASSSEAIGSEGRLYLYTVVHTAPPGYDGPVPYGFGLVDLPEGLRVVARLTESRIEMLTTGMRMRLEIAPLFVDGEGNEVLSYAYAPLAKVGGDA